MIQQAHLQLQEYWAKSSSSVAASRSSESAVKDLEERYGVKLPDDFRLYLLESSPEPNNLDESCTYWWPLAEIKNIPDEYKHDLHNAEVAVEAASYLFFADYMVWCWAWAICCKPGKNFGHIVQVGTGEIEVARSFSEFVSAYIKGRSDLF